MMPDREFQNFGANISDYPLANNLTVEIWWPILNKRKSEALKSSLRVESMSDFDG